MPTPTPVPCRGVECIEPAPDAFERRIFEPGERIDWENGVFFLDVETGRTEAYQLQEDGGLFAETYLSSVDGNWVWVLSRVDKTFLLDRLSNQAWQWNGLQLTIAAVSGENLLLENKGCNADESPCITFTIVNRALEMTGKLSIEIDDEVRAYWRQGFFSPNGDAVVLAVGKGWGDSIYIFHIGEEQAHLLHEARPVDRSWLGTEIDSLGSRGFQIKMTYHFEGTGIPEHLIYRRFDWNGEELVQAACPGILSPDGRYLLQQIGGPFAARYAGVVPQENPWPSIAISDAKTCEPVFRVHSAYTYQTFWEAGWLSNSEGFVARVENREDHIYHDEHVIVRVHPHPEIVYLIPSSFPDNVGIGGFGPVPAPAGDGCYFGYDFAGVYNACEDRWIETGFGPDHWGPFSWDDADLEMQYLLGYWGEGGLSWETYGPPSIEFPPFSDELTFRVARTGTCLYLRAEPDRQAVALDCLADGSPVFAKPRLMSYSGAYPDVIRWVHVRAESGAEGWVSRNYLEWW